MLFSLLTRMLLLGVAQAVIVASRPGPFAVAVRVQTLTDQGRADPFNSTEKRRVLLSVFWPIIGPSNCSQDIVPYMPPATSASYGALAESAGLPANLFDSFQLEFCKPSLQTAGCQVRKGKIPRFPLVLFSPGLGESRLLYSVTAKSIAAQGYIVAMIDHPYDAEVVEFPDGSVVRRNWTAGMEQRLTEIRATDISFTLSHFTTSGRLFPNDPKHPPAQIDLDRIIAMGHSIGGAAAAQALQQDGRIRGGINLDGRLFSPVLDPSPPPSPQQQQRNRPLMLLGREKHADEDSTWDQFWRSNKKLAASAVMLGVRGTSHSSFTDVPGLVEALGLPEEARSRVEEMLGVVGGRRMQQILVELSSSFFTWAFGGGYGGLAEAAGGLEEVVVFKSSFGVV